MEIIQLKDHPDIAAVVKLVSKKHKAILAPRTNEVRLSGTYWDGGSRASYYLIHVATKAVTPLPHYPPPQFPGGVRLHAPQPLEPGYMIVESGVFNGKPSMPTVYRPLV